MSLPAFVPLVAVGVGLALVGWSWVQRSRDGVQGLAELIEVDVGAPTPEDDGTGVRSSVVEGVVRLAATVVARLDRRGSLGNALERARIPLRAGEYAIASLAGGLSFAAVLLAVTKQPALAALTLVLTPLGARFWVNHRIAKRRRAFEAQLPGALTLVASSLAAGHTFLRAIQMMCEESEPPMAEEFGRLVSETQLGDPVVDALARMAERLKIRDLDWVVQAIRIQQTVGGRLADLLHTLADFIRSRDEVRREVMVLTAEGRISAWVLAALPPFLLLTIQVVNPTYMKPIYHGKGLVVLVGSAVSVILGTGIILRMVKIEV